uniref:Uncharacterized protein n=1 Tax=Chenopodium quinoa TaxID=63459 RepID=A0A803LQ45_CHEQI
MYSLVFTVLYSMKYAAGVYVLYPFPQNFTLYQACWLPGLPRLGYMCLKQQHQNFAGICASVSLGLKSYDDTLRNENGVVLPGTMSLQRRGFHHLNQGKSLQFPLILFIVLLVMLGDLSNPEKSLNPGLDSIGDQVPDTNFIRIIARALCMCLMVVTGELPMGRAGSTIVHLTSPGKYKILRPGEPDRCSLVCSEFSVK